MEHRVAEAFAFGDEEHARLALRPD